MATLHSTYRPISIAELTDRELVTGRDLILGEKIQVEGVPRDIMSKVSSVMISPEYDLDGRLLEFRMDPSPPKFELYGYSGNLAQGRSTIPFFIPAYFGASTRQQAKLLAEAAVLGMSAIVRGSLDFKCDGGLELEVESVQFAGKSIKTIVRPSPRDS